MEAALRTRALLAELRDELADARRERRALRRALSLAASERAARDAVAEARVALAAAEHDFAAARHSMADEEIRSALTEWLRACEVMAAGGAQGDPSRAVREHVLNAMGADDARHDEWRLAVAIGISGGLAFVCLVVGIQVRWLWLVALLSLVAACALAPRWWAARRAVTANGDALAASERRLVEDDALRRVCARLGGSAEALARSEARLRALSVATPADAPAARARLADLPPGDAAQQTAARLVEAQGVVERRRALLEVALTRLARLQRARLEHDRGSSAAELERRMAAIQARIDALGDRARAQGVMPRLDALSAARGAAEARANLLRELLTSTE
jgi:hypothetical protein